MTNREFFMAVMNGETNEETIAFATNEIAKMDERNAKRRELNSAKLEKNKSLCEAIFAKIEEGVTYTANDIFDIMVDLKPTLVANGLIEEDAKISIQKASTLAGIMAEFGWVIKSDVHIKNKGTVKGYTKA